MRSSAVSVVALVLVWVHGARGAEGIPLDTWPKSWFEAPRTASELGIAEFAESPMLAARVKAGELPPLRERLPQDPIVIEPAERIGRHGGTARVFSGDARLLIALEPALIMGPAVAKILPNQAKGWELGEAGRVLTLFLRPGAKWSDGHPVTADDYVFWFEHVLCHEELTPVREPRWRNSNVTKVDDFTVRFEFERPNPFFVKELAHHGDGYLLPGHFLKDYHVDFVPKEELEKEAQREGYISWMNYFGAVRGERGADVFGCPTLNPFLLEKKSPTVIKYVRNPYYPKIDPAGNQLPYIDRIEAQDIRNEEVMAAKAATGQVDYAAGSLKTSDIPLYKLGQRHNPFRVYIWNRLHGVDVVIQPNLTSEDRALRAIFQDFRFRRALSIAINREEINGIVYFGHGTPRQTTVIPSSKFYREEFAKAHTEYDPAAARKLLDEMGMKDKDGDGKRERPDGSPLDIRLEWCPMETPKGITMELVTDYWRAVGLHIGLRQVDGALQGSHARANLMQMTLWHADRTSDILFPPEPFWFVPMHSNWEECHWMQWSTWYLTEGEKGEEPIPPVMQLLDWWKEMRTTVDIQRRVELGRNILRSQAENLWTIGTIGLAPQPVVVGNRLHNVPTRGYWGWDNRWTLPYHPCTWYLDER